MYADVAQLVEQRFRSIKQPFLAHFLFIGWCHRTQCQTPLQGIAI
jgi:hypothetical protein